PKNTEPIPLPGQNKAKVTGNNISRGTFGTYGVTAMLTAGQYNGAPNATVTMEIDATPEKDFTVIQAQEEGRQTNNTLSNTHHTQQYDAYGRPRIGFSREPYDFAATKYITATSQIKFQENVESTRMAYGNYMIDPTQAKKDVSSDDVKVFGMDNAPKPGMVDPNFKNPELIGQEYKKSEGMIDISFENTEILGHSAKPDGQMIKPDESVADSVPLMGEKDGESKEAEVNAEKSIGQSIIEVAEKMGIDIKAILKPGDPDEAAQAHDVTDLAAKAAVSISV
ncbi:MAG: hypothetical protein V3S46_04415, partial [Nitrospinota bacterium]